MTIKTDYHSIVELKKQYDPCTHGFVNQYEADQIKTILEIKDRNDIELQNVRDMAVILYSYWAEDEREKANAQEAIKLMDTLSAVCFVIDQEKFGRAWRRSHNCDKANLDIATLQRAFGHSSSEVTLRYLGITEEEDNKM